MNRLFALACQQTLHPAIIRRLALLPQLPATIWRDRRVEKVVLTHLPEEEFPHRSNPVRLASLPPAREIVSQGVIGSAPVSRADLFSPHKQVRVVAIAAERFADISQRTRSIAGECPGLAASEQSACATGIAFARQFIIRKCAGEVTLCSLGIPPIAIEQSHGRNIRSNDRTPGLRPTQIQQAGAISNDPVPIMLHKPSVATQGEGISIIRMILNSLIVVRESSGDVSGFRFSFSPHQDFGLRLKPCSGYFRQRE